MSELAVETVHRADCTFGPGFFRVALVGSTPRYCQTLAEVRLLASMVGQSSIQYVERDGHCLDGDRQGDANTPDVVDGETWLALPRREAMLVVGLESEADYARVYKQVEAAVYRRDNRAAQSGVRASIVIKKRGAHVVDV